MCLALLQRDRADHTDGFHPSGSLQSTGRGIGYLALRDPFSSEGGSVGGDLRKCEGAREGWQVLMSLTDQASLRRGARSWDARDEKSLAIWKAKAGVPGKAKSARAQKWG